jgi:hypothetical protein
MNAKQEFLNEEMLCARAWNTKIVCAYVYQLNDRYEAGPTINLPIDYTTEEYESFLNQLDFDYNDGYGGQVLFGTIWFANGNWATRAEYDGSEWWEIHSKPEIPGYLKNN